MRVKNFDPNDMGDNMLESWAWVCAIDAWDYCDPGPLSALILNENIPDPLRPVIADIVSGQRKQKKKAADKLKIPAAERMKVAGAISTILGLCNSIQSDVIDDNHPGMKGAAMLGDRMGKEPIDIMSDVRGQADEVKQMAAREFNISVETVENLLRALRGKIDKWPNI